MRWNSERNAQVVMVISELHYKPREANEPVRKLEENNGKHMKLTGETLPCHEPEDCSGKRCRDLLLVCYLFACLKNTIVKPNAFFTHNVAMFRRNILIGAPILIGSLLQQLAIIFNSMFCVEGTSH